MKKPLILALSLGLLASCSTAGTPISSPQESSPEASVPSSEATSASSLDISSDPQGSSEKEKDSSAEEESFSQPASQSSEGDSSSGEGSNSEVEPTSGEDLSSGEEPSSGEDPSSGVEPTSEGESSIGEDPSSEPMSHSSEGDSSSGENPTSGEDPSSGEGSSSEPETEKFAIHYGTAQGHKAVGELTEAAYGDVVSFTIDSSSALPNYDLDTVTVHAGSASGSTVRVKEKEGVYTFTMPENEAYIVLTTTAYYEVSVADITGGSVTLNKEEPRYKVGEKVTMTLTLDEGYLLESAYYVKLYGTSPEDVPLKFEEGVATFYMPQIDVEIHVDTKAKPDPEDEGSDPFIDAPAVYKGKKEIYYYGYYDLEVTITLNGDGTLNTKWEVYYEEDPWGDDYWAILAAASVVRDDAKSNIVYAIDMSERTLSFVNPTHNETIVLSFANATLGDDRQPDTMKMTAAYRDDYAGQAANMILEKTIK